jgi:hypothetical protein
MMKLKYWSFGWVLILTIITPRLGIAFNSSELESDNFFVVFNQPQYAPGDTAFFTGYLPAEALQSIGKKQVVNIKLLGQNNALILQERVLFVDGVGANQLILPQTLEPGIYQLIFYFETKLLSKTPTLYTKPITISGKSLSFNSRNASLVLDNSKLTIKPSSDTVKVRSKVNVVVAPGATLIKNRSTLLAVTVYNKRIFNDSNSFRHSVLSMSPSPDSQPIDPQQIISPDIVDHPYFFVGKAIIKSTGEAVPDQSKVTFYLNKSDFTYEITINSGYFVFPLFRNFESEEVFYRISYKGKFLKDGQIIPTDFQAPMVTGTYEKTDAQDAYGLYAHQKEIIRKSYDYFRSRENNEELIVDDGIESDQEINLEKFEPFVSMSEVLTNVVPMVTYKKTKDAEGVRIFIQKTAKYGDGDPLFIVNGVMTDDTKGVLSLEPSAVQKIGVLRSEKALRRYGDLGREGILVITTKEKKENIIETRNALLIKGISKALVYPKSTSHDATVKARIPDLRSSLYWNPVIKLNEQTSFDFYTSDDTGYYVIQIIGFQDGKLFITESEFYVSN